MSLDSSYVHQLSRKSSVRDPSVNQNISLSSIVQRSTVHAVSFIEHVRLWASHAPSCWVYPFSLRQCFTQPANHISSTPRSTTLFHARSIVHDLTDPVSRPTWLKSMTYGWRVERAGPGTGTGPATTGWSIGRLNVVQGSIYCVRSVSEGLSAWIATRTLLRV